MKYLLVAETYDMAVKYRKFISGKLDVTPCGFPSIFSPTQPENYTVLFMGNWPENIDLNMPTIMDLETAGYNMVYGSDNVEKYLSDLYGNRWRKISKSKSRRKKSPKK